MSARGPVLAAELLKALHCFERLSVRELCVELECSENAVIHWIGEWEEQGIVVSRLGTKGRTGKAPKVYSLSSTFGGSQAQGEQA